MAAEDSGGALDEWFVNAAVPTSRGFVTSCWVLWRILLALNIRPRLVWGRENPEGLPKSPPEVDECFDPFVNWPHLHWIAMAEWVCIAVVFFLTLGFTWLGLRTSLSAPGFGSWTRPLIAIAVSAVMAVVGVTLGWPDFVARAAGAKVNWGVRHYTLFLVEFVERAMLVALMTVSYAVTAASRSNPAMLATFERFWMDTDMRNGSYFNYGPSPDSSSYKRALTGETSIVHSLWE
jgi:hypothetical protein